MPVFRNKVAVEIARGFKVFLALEAGAVRGALPEERRKVELRHKDRQLALQRQRIQSLEGWVSKKDQNLDNLRRKLAEEQDRAQEQAAKRREIQGSYERTSDTPGKLIDPGSLVWIFCPPRSGSTWLYNMLDELDEYAAWHEPLIGQLFGAFHERNAHRGGKHYILGGKRDHWLHPIRSFVLEAASAKFPEVIAGSYLAVKEPGSAIGAPLLMEALPESRMIFLVRDPRDVAASSLDATRKGSWFRERREQKQAKPTNRFAFADADPDEHVRKNAKGYVRQTGKAKDAYESHGGPKVLVTYEELVADTLGAMKRIHETLGVQVDERDLARVVEKNSWGNIPEEERGEGKFYRKGSPGSWREDLTPEQARIVEQVTAPLVSEYYPDLEGGSGVTRES